MTGVHLNRDCDDATRRNALYAGDIFLFSSTPATRELAAFAMQMIEEAFAPYPAREAQRHMPVEEWVARFAPVKPAFIHHPTTREIMKRVVAELGADPATTFLDVPRLRGVTSDGYLTSGVGYAHHPHRDTWYSAPMAQLNWWLPLHEVVSESSMAFHHAYFDRAVKNGSAEFNYYEWNAVGRKEAAKQIGADTRKQPKPEEPVVLEPEARYLPEPGGVIVFSAAQLHSTVPNTSGLARFSIDFRTVNLDDLVTGAGAPNVDSACTGTSLRDFRNVATDEPVPDELVDRYDIGGRPADGALVFVPERT
jgi:hypothetical protein